MQEEVQQLEKMEITNMFCKYAEANSYRIPNCLKNIVEKGAELGPTPPQSSKLQHSSPTRSSIQMSIGPM